MNELSTNKLTNFQLELIKLFQMDVSNDDLNEIKSMIARYLADKATKDFDELIIKNGIDSDSVSNWQFEHNRIHN